MSRRLSLSPLVIGVLPFGPSARHEFHWLRALAPLGTARLGLPFSSQGLMTDACPSGYGLCVGDLSTSEAKPIARWDERLRFKRDASVRDGGEGQSL